MLSFAIYFGTSDQQLFTESRLLNLGGSSSSLNNDFSLKADPFFLAPPSF